MPRATLLRRSPVLAALAAGLALAGTGQASAQSSACQEGGKHLQERQDLVKQLNSLGSKKVDPSKACTMLTKLTANGSKAISWLDANKDWCQIPEQFANNFREDHKRVTDLRGKACKAAVQQTEMMRKARQAAQNGGGGGGLLGGPGLSGEYKIPQGAL